MPKNQLNPLSRFSRTPTCDGQTQTDTQTQTEGRSTYRASITLRGKNQKR